jgi:KDO2-lipid IV(A) lauroyltransferase
MTRLAFRLEAAAVRLFLRLFRALGPVRASNLGGALARAIGPLLPVSRVADTNLRLALPHLDARGRRRVVRGAWENLGRTMGEFPHLGRLRQNTPAGPGWEMVGEQTLKALAAKGGPAIFFSGHIGNWEMLPAACAAYGLPFSSMFRAASNPEVDALVIALRREAMGTPVPMFAKGASGAKAALAHMKAGGYLGLLMDQKMNDGIEATLFGYKAMTAPAMAALALRFRCPVIPGHVQRMGPARFRLVCEPPMALPDSGDRRQDLHHMTQAMNGYLERWIRERPEGWLWMHRRWPKEVYRVGGGPLRQDAPRQDACHDVI